jgi:4'-phosphopantetheinyl transferase
MKASWEKSPLVPKLPIDQVHVWRVHWPSFKSNLPDFEKILNKQELERASRFKFPKDRECSIITRGILRTLLARYLELEPAALEFTTNSHGKPALKPESLLHFNFSDSHEFALFAFVQNYEIGVDIEQVRADIEAEDIAIRFFSKAEISSLLSLPKQQRLKAFFNCWTRKEAFIKALGLGLSYGLDKFDVDLINEEGSLLLAVRDDLIKVTDCSLLALNPVLGYTGALAVLQPNEAPEFKFRFFQYLNENML